MRDHAVVAMVGAAGRDDDHLALRLAEAAALLRHERVVVGEEGAELVGPVGEDEEDVGHEARLFLHGEDPGADVVGQVGERRHRKARDRQCCEGHGWRV